MARRGRGRGRGRGRKTSQSEDASPPAAGSEEPQQEQDTEQPAQQESLYDDEELQQQPSDEEGEPTKSGEPMFASDSDSDNEGAQSSDRKIVGGISGDEDDAGDILSADTPPREEDTPPREEDSPPREEDSPTREDTSSREDTPPRENTPPREGTLPREDESDEEDTSQQFNMFSDEPANNQQGDMFADDPVPEQQDEQDQMLQGADTPPRIEPSDEDDQEVMLKEVKQEVKQEEEEDVTADQQQAAEVEMQQQMYEQQGREQAEQKTVFAEQERVEAERLQQEQEQHRQEEEQFEREKKLQEEEQISRKYKEISQYEWPTFSGQVKKKPSAKEETEERESQYRKDLRERRAEEKAQEETSKLEKEKGQSKKKGKKKKKRRKKARSSVITLKQQHSDSDEDSDVEIEYVQEKIELPKSDPNYAVFNAIFETFKIEEKVEEKPEVKTEVSAVKKTEPGLERDPLMMEDDMLEAQEDDGKKLSKKKLKELNRMKIADLKQTVNRPDVVEMHDVNSKDPKLLAYLKAYKNTVPVPRHWCFKRKYLQGKRGFVKPPFELPEFIKNTGIMEMRAAMQEKEDQKTLKSKQRGKVRPKLGKIDIDYQKLHDAFFKYQTKPRMTIHGDLYYEGKEFELQLKEKKPGDMSDELRTALGMPIEEGKDMIPPPWLIAMQRYGPPPSYPSLKIQGLNAPIPESAAFGYHAGGWGKPPVDEGGKPLYGDVFGTKTFVEEKAEDDDDGVDKTLWGELESESESEDESEEEEEDEEEATDATGLVTPADAGLATPSGISSVGAGMETPDMIELRKKKEIEDAMDTGGDTPALYTVLQEKQRNVGASMMGSSHAYDLATKKPGSTAGDAVELTLDPSELEMGIEMDPTAMAAKYEQRMQERQTEKDTEDFSDMVADHNKSQNKKRKKPAAEKKEQDKGAKKYKEFKF